MKAIPTGVSGIPDPAKISMRIPVHMNTSIGLG